MVGLQMWEVMRGSKRRFWQRPVIQPAPLVRHGLSPLLLASSRADERKIARGMDQSTCTECSRLARDPTARVTQEYLVGDGAPVIVDAETRSPMKCLACGGRWLRIRRHHDASTVWFQLGRDAPGHLNN